MFAMVLAISNVHQIIFRVKQKLFVLDMVQMDMDIHIQIAIIRTKMNILKKLDHLQDLQNQIQQCRFLCGNDERDWIYEMTSDHKYWTVINEHWDIFYPVMTSNGFILTLCSEGMTVIW